MIVHSSGPCLQRSANSCIEKGIYRTRRDLSPVSKTCVCPVQPSGPPALILSRMYSSGLGFLFAIDRNGRSSSAEPSSWKGLSTGKEAPKNNAWHRTAGSGCCLDQHNLGPHTFRDEPPPTDFLGRADRQKHEQAPRPWLACTFSPKIEPNKDARVGNLERG